MLIIQTQRLEIREFVDADQPYFEELVTAPEIINPVPAKKWSPAEVIERFNSFKQYAEPTLEADKTLWGVYETGKTELIGLAAILTNDENHRELGYRFRQKYWGKGYGTEVAKALIDYCFEVLQLELITADVNITNIGSVKILEKFLYPVREFFNQADNCTDRRYHLTREQWSQK